MPRPETGAEGGEGGAEAQGSQLKSRMGILTEACDPTCDGNTAQFKGVFVRNLARLYLARPNENGELKVFLERNARSIWERARAGGGGEREERGFPQEARLGSDWLGPYSAVDAEGEDVSATAMCSGLDGLVAAAAAVVVVAGNANNS